MTQVFSPETAGRFGFHYDRTKALLQPTSRFTELLAPLGISPVPEIDMAFDVANIGPGAIFPRRRIQNRFQLYTDLSRTLGRHTLKAGWSTTRIQVNDLQSDNSRGTVRFASDFGRTAVQNFLDGRPKRLHGCNWKPLSRFSGLGTLLFRRGPDSLVSHLQPEPGVAV